MNHREWSVSLNTIICEILDKEYSAQIVGYTLNHRSNASKDVNRHFDEMMRQYIRIDGFRPGKGLKTVMLQKIVNEYAYPHPVFKSILLVWMDIKSDLRDAAQMF